jgi:alpha-tubulin suppressor-like RCC1 family protein
VEIKNPTNGVVTGSSLSFCQSNGNCSFEFDPDDPFTGDATVEYRVLDFTDSDVFVRQSEWKLVTISISATDEAPVANNFSETLGSHALTAINIDLGSEYTDREEDLATVVSIVSDEGGAAVFDNCTAGNCIVNFTPDAGYAGLAKVVYTVTANGEVSNQATIDITIPDDLDLDFTLAWGAAPSLTDQCTIAVAGVVTPAGGSTCGGLPCTTYTGDIANTVSTLNNETADINGFSGGLNVWNTPGQHLTKWTVGDGSNTATLARYLELAESAPTNLKRPVTSLSPDYINSMEGTQSGTAGCTGNSCSGGWGAIAGGDDFTCTMLVDSRIACFGDQGADGKLGHNSVTDTDTPTPVQAEFGNDVYGFVAVTAGQNHACGLHASGQVSCWGSNGSGQLGDNSTTGRDHADYVKDVAGTGILANIKSVSAGANHTCAVDSSRNVYCWGDNDNGQLGNGLTADSDLPVAVQKITSKSGSTVNTTADLDNAFSVSAGYTHTCAVQIAPDNVTSRVLCWGSNSDGQIGDNDYHSATESNFSKVHTSVLATDDRLYPTIARDGSDNAAEQVVSVVTGDRFSCALETDGDVKCWGKNDIGQLGHGLTGTYVNAVEAVGGGSSLTDVVAISADGEHACALLDSKKVACWGSDFDGELGNGGANAFSTVPVMVLDTTNSGELGDIVAVAAGASHACAHAADGTTHCWGSNDYGEAGVTPLGDQGYPNSGVTDDSGSTLHSSRVRSCSKVFTFGLP